MFAPNVFAGNALIPGTPSLERPTLTTLNIVFPVSGDDNYTASVAVRYRKSGSSAWQNAQPLYHVHPETVAGQTVAPQFAGRIFDLRPGVSYDVELHVVDADGGVDQTYLLTGTTRSVPPANPQTPRTVAVANTAQLLQAMSTAQAGDVITLASGVYSGTFMGLNGTGTAQNPIVLRGADPGNPAGAILDGAGCTDCNVLEVYGAGYVIIENLTIRNAFRALRLQTPGAIGNVVRRVAINNVVQAISGKNDQLDLYIADNVMQGRLVWPLTTPDDGAVHASDTGIQILGQGHVVTHNQISGFGDAIDIAQSGSRAIDISGNDVLWTYDNGIELDGGEGNVAAFRNRLTNTFMPISVQPVIAGPGYIHHNVIANSVDEPLKFHGLAITPPREPNGVFVYHNTIWMNDYALKVMTPAASHHFALENNIFMGPMPTRFGITVDWNGVIDDGLFDYNGYFPEGKFYSNRGGYHGFDNFAAWQAGGFEPHGLLVNASTFASGMAGPESHLALQAPPDASLSAGSLALDRGVVLANINDDFRGAAPDLGAQEKGCPQPIYGPRPVGVDESNEVWGCAPTVQSAITITTVSLANGTVGAAFTQTLQASGGSGNSIWSLATGSGSLPAGLTLSAAGVISGTPGLKGTSTIAVQAADGSSAGTKTFSLTINPAPPPLGGPPSWLASPAGDVVTNTKGGITRIHGTTYYTSAIFQQTVAGSGDTLDLTLTGATAWGSLILQPPAGASGTTFAFILQTGYLDLYATPPGQANYVWLGQWPVTSASHVLVRSLNNSLTFSLDGTAPLNYSAALAFPLSLRWSSVVDGQGLASASIANASGTAQPLSITTAALAGGTAGTPYTQALQASGGTGSYTWTLSAGSSLPSGLTLNAATGAIFGTPGSAGASAFTVQVADGFATPLSKTFTLTIASAGASPATWVATPAGDVVVNTSGGIKRIHGTTYYTRAIAQQTISASGMLDFTLSSVNGWGFLILQPPAGTPGTTFAFVVQTGYIDIYAIPAGQSNYVWVGGWSVTIANHIQATASNGTLTFSVDGAAPRSYSSGLAFPLTVQWSSVTDGQGLVTATIN